MRSIYHNFFDLHGSGGRNLEVVTLSYQHVVFPFLLLGCGAICCLAVMAAEKVIKC